MMSGRFLKALGAFAGGCLALAGSLSTARAEVNWDFSLGAGGYVTDNLHLGPEPSGEGDPDPVHERALSFSPAARLEWVAPLDRLNFAYSGQYLTFSGDEDRDPEWINELTANLGWRRWEPFFLESGAVYERVPQDTGDPNEAIVDQSDRTSLFVRTGFSWAVGATGTAELAYRGEIESFSGGAGDNQDDRIVRHYVGGLVRRRFGPLWEGEASARYGRITQELVEDSNELRLAAALSRRLSERLNARVHAEWVRDDPDSGDGDGEGDTDAETEFLKGVEFRGDLERGGFWSLSYQDSLQSQADGDTVTVGRAEAACSLRARLGSVVSAAFWHEDRNYRIAGTDETTWGPTVTARWLVAHWIALDVLGSWEETTTREPDVGDVEDRTTRVAAAVVAILGRHLTAEAGYLYRENDSTTEGDSYTANLFSASLTYHFKDIPGRAIPASAIVGM